MRYLTERQVKQLIDSIDGKHKNRDQTAILICFRHGLRESELLALTWEDVDLDQGKIFCQRLKGGYSSYHPLQGDEERRLRRLQREYNSRWLFPTIIGSPLAPRSFRDKVKQYGRKLGWRINAHLLRHSCGYHLNAQGLNARWIQDYLGHKSYASTIQYTEVDPDQFRLIQWRKNF
jgi:type 1 fimbriae regulatory protein FimB/type 1 fimbriae regulatory protein FimE